MTESNASTSNDIMPNAVLSETESNNDVNILLMGPSGVGKTTFINAFANYIKFSSLELAEAGEMEVLIPSSFALSGTGVEMEYEDQTITIGGTEDKYEQFSEQGQSSTQLCRSFVFPIGNRIIRLIDTPGVADCRGIEQDAVNFQEMLSFITQYNHLNAICILLKPNEERLTVAFQYSIKELLRHLHVTAKENLMFLFTNARSSFYRPGKTKKLLEVMFQEHHKTYNVDVKISPQNTFLFDNEAFRYLAIRKKGIVLDEYQSQSYVRSWEQSVNECLRLLKHSLQLPRHYVQRMISLNAAQQIIQQLPRPIAEISKLIEENIKLAENYKQQVKNNPSALSQGVLQKAPQIRQFTHPRTVCASDKCKRVIKNDHGETKIEYPKICHDNCFLKGVVQERLRHPNLENCEEMHWKTGNCLHCKCHWTEHIHITYEFVTDHAYYRNPRDHTESATTTSKSNLTSDDVQKLIEDLRLESQQIQSVYQQLLEFLQANAMLPINDCLIEYLEYFVREERTKATAQADNGDLISKIEALKQKHKDNLARLKKSLQERANPEDYNSVLKPKDIVNLVCTLYNLPINGSIIRQQMEAICTVQRESGYRQECRVKISPTENTSRVLTEMLQILSVE